MVAARGSVYGSGAVTAAIAGRTNWGKAVLETVARQGRTVVCHQYSQAPLQWLGPLQPESQRPLYYLRNPNGGLLQGDAQTIRIGLGTDTHLEIRTQSATRLHPGRSRQDIYLQLGDRSSLIWVNHPLIPGTQTEFAQQIQIDLAPTARLVYGEVWTAGRLALKAEFAYRGVEAAEAWQFTSLSNRIGVDCAGAPLVREALLSDFPHQALRSPGVLGHYTSWGSLYLLGDWPTVDWPESETHWSVASGSNRILRAVGYAAADLWQQFQQVALALAELPVSAAG